MVKFEKMTINDLKEHLVLQRRAFLPLLAKYQDGNFSPANITEAEMKKRIENSQGIYLKIILDSLDVGGIYAYTLNNGRNEMYLSTIYISNNMQGCGLAQESIKHLEEMCIGIKTWWLEVPEGENKNIHIYEKLGYQYTGKKIIINEKLTLLLYKK
ncbi:ribosomal protein S18 acetylase RimI-like enzyme [Sedimentibacter acidaminivorans]|uniref:Ribosomal protein S18 acetylase RimI-like enzyme n=1 Tax=Sedimentibacter acidaminivorans TaxID=913099 RepID=A0ABS4GCF2_9FIRM|nr:GNAT family N-acetyltransferase [Sedimentibacter acidaminivorans]MBP1925376.1 ribosomal protein S18 acetylase RimI-like enzyme [Sedimentibacter acidaminivorans]